jgi:hypothetical protein
MSDPHTDLRPLLLPIAYRMLGSYSQAQDSSGSSRCTSAGGRRPAGDRDGALVGVWALGIAGGEVVAVNGVVNPDKLTHLS